MNQYRAKQRGNGDWVVEKFENGRLVRWGVYGSGPDAERLAKTIVGQITRHETERQTRRAA